MSPLPFALLTDETLRPPDGAMPTPEGDVGWADIDGDHVLDLVMAHASRGILQVWPSTRPAAEPEIWPVTGACGRLTLNVDAPGTPRRPAWEGATSFIVTWSPDGTVVAAMHDGVEIVVDPVTEERTETTFAPEDVPYLGFFGDIDGDGRPDAGGATVHLSSTGLRVPFPDEPDAVQVVPIGDVDDDGYDDLAMGIEGAAHRSLVAYRGGPSGFASERLWTLGGETIEGLFGPEPLSVGVAVVRVPGTDRLAVSRRRPGHRQDAFERFDLVGAIGTSAPVVVQSFLPAYPSPLGGEEEFDMPLRLYAREAGGVGLMTVYDDRYLQWLPFDASSQTVVTTPEGWWRGGSPLDFQVSSGPDVGMAELTSTAPDSTGDSDPPVVWGWRPEVTPVPLEADDPRIVDCPPTVERGPDAARPTGAPRRDRGGCSQSGRRSSLALVALTSIFVRRRERRR